MPTGKRKNLNFYLFLSILFISILLLDRYSKSYVLNKILPFQSIPIIKDVFHISLVYNTGTAFGILKGNNFIFIIFSVIVILSILKQFRELSSNREFAVALTLIISGAIGNLIDRISLGYVVDFLDFRIWPVFNIADISISLGIILILHSLFIKK